jgi:hypothetical protein
MIDILIIFSSLLLTIISIVGGFLIIRDTKNKKGKWGINLKQNKCPRCGEPFPQIRTPSSFHQAMWGGSTCKSCGCEIDKWGNEIKKQNKT